MPRCPPAAAAALLLAAAPAAAAQPPDAEGARRTLVTGSDSVRVTIGGYLQADTRLAGGPVPGNDGVLLRRARLTLEAAGRGGWSLRLQPDFGQGRAQIQDGFVAWSSGASALTSGAAGARAAGARAGRFRPPFGVERTLPSAALLFPERSVLNAFMPNRLFGAEAAVRRPRWALTAGAFQAAGVRDALVDTDGDPVGVAQAGADAALRASWRPLGAAAPGAPPRLELQAGAMAGHYRGNNPVFPGVDRFLTAALRPALAWRGAGDAAAGDTVAGGAAAATFADGARRRVTLGGQWARGPLHVLAEAAWLAQRVRLGAIEPDAAPLDRALLRHAGWHVRVGWLAGGGRTADYDVRPRGRRGALELGARAAGARFDPASTRFAAPAADARALANGGLALAWVPRPGTRLALSGDLTRLTPAPGAAPRGTERAAVLRVQQSF